MIMHRPFPVRRPAGVGANLMAQGVGGIVSGDTAGTIGWGVSVATLGAAVYVGLRGNFITGAILAVASVPAGLATMAVLGGPYNQPTT